MLRLDTQCFRCNNCLLFFQKPTSLGLLTDLVLKILLDCPKRSIQQVVSEMLEHYFARTRIGNFQDEDIRWFLKLFEDENFNKIFYTKESGVRLLKFYLSRILSTSSIVFENPLGIFDNKVCLLHTLLGRHGSASLCRVERENKMAATYNVLAFKR